MFFTSLKASNRFLKPSMFSAISVKFLGTGPYSSSFRSLKGFCLMRWITSMNQPVKTPFICAGPPGFAKPEMLKGDRGQASLKVKPAISSPRLSVYFTRMTFFSCAQVAVQCRPSAASSHSLKHPQISDSSWSMFTIHLPPSAWPAIVPCTWSTPEIAFKCARAPTPAKLLLRPPEKALKVVQSSKVAQRGSKETRNLEALGR
mmetsp:Transcript_17885/g.39433  ORF Transcript_17885/g.39433 Transcript_17885/m.39433 type:complete len:203 (+) Transcript_17885:873-1481(+)